MASALSLMLGKGEMVLGPGHSSTGYHTVHATGTDFDVALLSPVVHLGKVVACIQMAPNVPLFLIFTFLCNRLPQ